MPFSKMLFGTVDVIGHDMGDSCSRAISLGSGSQAAADRTAHGILDCPMLVSFNALCTHCILTLSKLVDRVQASGMGGGLALATKPSEDHTECLVFKGRCCTEMRHEEEERKEECGRERR